MSKKRRKKKQTKSRNASRATSPSATRPLSSRSPEEQNGLNEYQRGLDAMNRGDYAGSLPHFHQAAQILGGRADLFLHFGRALLRSGHTNDAINALARSIALDDKNPDAWALLGSSYENSLRYPEAREAYARALDLDNTHLDALTGFAWMLCIDKQIDQAVAISRHGTEVATNNAAAWCSLALSCHLAGAEEEADHALSIAVSIDHRISKQYRMLLGSYYRDIGQFDRAADHYQTAYNEDPSDLNLLISLTNVREIAPTEPLFQVLRDAVCKGADEVQQQSIHISLAKIYGKDQQHDLAFKHYAAANRLKGKWFPYDQAAEHHHADIIRKLFADVTPPPQEELENRPRPIFILGMPRSGTTLVEQILGSHPNVTPAGELTLFPGLLNSLSLSDSTVWSNALEKALRQVGDRYRSEIGRLTEDGSHFVTDKLPTNSFHLGFIPFALPDAIIIHCMRDPRDTCVSCFMTDFNTGNLFSHDLRHLGDYYTLYFEQMKFWRAKFPGRFLDVRYEDVVDDQEGQTRRILDHCGLSWDERCLHFHQTERMVRTASYAQVRKPIYRGSIGRWKRYEPHLEPLLEILRKLPESFFC